MSEPEPIGAIIKRTLPVRIVIPGPPATYQKKTGMWHTKDFTRFGTNSYDLKGYKQWRDYARGRAAEVCEGMTVWNGPVVLSINAYFLPPQSMSRKRLAMALAGYERPFSKDCDNVAKAAQDSCLTGIVIRDDKQVVSLHVDKWFAESARVELIVTPWTGPEPLFQKGD